MNSSMYFHFNSFFIVRATKLILEIIFPSRPHEHMLVKTPKYIITVEKDWGMLKYEKYPFNCFNHNLYFSDWNILN